MTGCISLRGGAARRSLMTRVLGESRLEWDTDRPDSLAECEAIWRASARDGMAFFDGRTGFDLPRSEVTQGFDPKTAPRETVIVAPMAGG